MASLSASMFLLLLISLDLGLFCNVEMVINWICFYIYVYEYNDVKCRHEL